MQLLQRCRLVYPRTPTSLHLESTSGGHRGSNCLDEMSNIMSQLLNMFPEVVNPSKKLPTAVHDVQHFIKTVGPPVASRFRRLEGAKLQAARAELDQMERDGIVRRSTSPWASPLHTCAPIRDTKPAFSIFCLEKSTSTYCQTLKK